MCVGISSGDRNIRGREGADILGNLQHSMRIFAIVFAFWFLSLTPVSAVAEVMVTGHKNPDADSICSAIGYAAFKRMTGTNAMAVRAGDIN